MRNTNFKTVTKQLSFASPKEKISFDNITSDLAAERKTTISAVVANAVRQQINVGEPNIDWLVELMYDGDENRFTPGDVLKSIFSIAASGSTWGDNEQCLIPLLDYMIRNDGICYFGVMNNRVDEGDIDYCVNALKQIKDALKDYLDGDEYYRKKSVIVYDDTDDFELMQAVKWFTEFYDCMVKDKRMYPIVTIMGWLRKYWNMICHFTYASRLVCKLCEMSYAWDERNPAHARLELINVLKDVAPRLRKS
ncbi:MAG: hypothetical protein K6G45_05550 [Lachnospiraceae bacterium]|nr:hypothetical protein [Lachnospiraceae bacterium]